MLRERRDEGKQQDDNDGWGEREREDKGSGKAAFGGTTIGKAAKRDLEKAAVEVRMGIHGAVIGREVSKGLAADSNCSKDEKKISERKAWEAAFTRRRVKCAGKIGSEGLKGGTESLKGKKWGRESEQWEFSRRSERREGKGGEYEETTLARWDIGKGKGERKGKSLGREFARTSERPLEREGKDTGGFDEPRW